MTRRRSSIGFFGRFGRSKDLRQLDEALRALDVHPATVPEAVKLTVVNLLNRPPIWVELLVYVVLGILWALPFKFIFRGVGKEDPDQDQQ